MEGRHGVSANESPVPPFEFSQTGDFQDSFTYTVPASGEVQPYTATATFANSSGQAIQPTISLYSAQGNLLARVYPADDVADGDTDECTWMPPFGSAASTPSPSGTGIQFDTDNEGGWLEVTTNDVIPSGPNSGYGMALVDDTSLPGSSGMLLYAPNSDMTLRSDHGLNVPVTGTYTQSATITVIIGATNVDISGAFAGVSKIHLCKPTDELGFFNKAGVVQAATPATLGDVITLLQNYGLCA